MSEATEKQTAILLKNGFKEADIDRMNKKAISDEIGKIFNKGKDPSKIEAMGQIGATGGISVVSHKFQNAYEFGPAGNRHTIRYWDVADLKAQMTEIENAGFLYETEKIK